MQKHSSKFWNRVLPAFALLCLASPNSAKAQNVPASWKRYDGKYFSFSLPPTWKLTQVNDADVQMQAPESPQLTMEVEHTIVYGSNVQTMLAVEKTALQNLAPQLGLNVTFRGYTADRRSGTSITAMFDDGIHGIVLEAWVCGVVIGNSMYIIRMRNPADSFDYIGQYQAPLVDSIAFHFPTTSVAGTWTSLDPKAESCGGITSTPRNYTVTLALSTDGRYTYSVHQSDIPTWDLRVAGTWAVTDPNPYLSQNAGQIRLTPTSSDLQPAGTSAAEMPLLSCQGYPIATAESFEVHTQSDGDLHLGRLVNNSSSAFKLTNPGTTPTPTLSITDAAAFSSGPVAQGSLVSLFGSFAVTQTAASSLPLPTSLSQLSVTVAGRAAPLLFVSPTQVNLQVPFETPEGNAAVAVSVNGATTLTGTIAVARTAPKLFGTPDATHAVAANEDYSPNGIANPAKPGSYLIVYVTGQGAFRTTVASGAAAPTAPLALTSAPTTATIGGQVAAVAFSGGAPGFAGVAQINVQVPSGLVAGDYPMVVTVGGVASNARMVSVKPSGDGVGTSGGGMKVYVIRSGDPDSDNALADLLSKQGHAVTLGVRAADLDQNAVQLSDYNSVVALGGSNYYRDIFPAAGRDMLKRYLTSSGGLIADGSIVNVELWTDTFLAPLLPAQSCGALGGRATSLTRVAPADSVLPSSLPSSANLSLFPVFFGTTTYSEICLSPVTGATTLYSSQQPGEAKSRPGIVAGEVGATSRAAALSVPVRKSVLDNADFGSMFGGLLQWTGAKTQVTQPAPGSVPAGQLRIFVLRSGDSDSDNMVMKSLSDRGHTPTLGPLATAFDGSGVDLTRYQVVIALGGAIGSGSMPGGGLTAVKNYLHGAGGLIADSQLIQNEMRNDRIVVPLLPGTSCGELTHGTTVFERVGPSDPILMAGVPASFNVNLTLGTYNESCLAKTDGAKIFQYSLSAGENSPHPAVLGNEPDVHSRAVLYSTAIQRRELGAPSFLSLFVNTVEWVAAHK